MRTSGTESIQPPGLDTPVLAEVVRRLAEAYCPESIYLFGSTARGDAGPDSDYDLMVIVREDAPSALADGRSRVPGSPWNRNGR